MAVHGVLDRRCTPRAPLAPASLHAVGQPPRRRGVSAQVRAGARLPRLASGRDWSALLPASEVPCARDLVQVATSCLAELSLKVRYPYGRGRRTGMRIVNVTQREPNYIYGVLYFLLGVIIILLQWQSPMRLIAGGAATSLHNS
jgi:hypothetical protein